MADFILDPVHNVAKAHAELRDKFDKFVAGKADDREAEHPGAPLRRCKHAETDPRYLNDCRNCALAARKIDIREGMPHYKGAPTRYELTPLYPQPWKYEGLPDRADFACDWPYAARRYNGGGNLSYHYQARILRNLLD